MGSAARYVSLVPSLTETLFELGVGESVVGATKFCVHPRPAVDEVPRVGGPRTLGSTGSSRCPRPSFSSIRRRTGSRTSSGCELRGWRST